LKEAETQFQKAIELQIKGYGKENPILATMFNNLGLIYKD